MRNLSIVRRCLMALLVGSSALPALGQENKSGAGGATQPQVQVKPAEEVAPPPRVAPSEPLPPRFGPRGLRIKEKETGGFVGSPDFPGWPEARSTKALPEIADPEIAQAIKLLDGFLTSEAMSGSAMGAEADLPALQCGMGRVDVSGLDNAVYFEFARTDSSWRPHRQGIMHLYRAGGGLRLRLFAFSAGPSFGDAAATLWIAPELFPDLDVSKLLPLADIPLTKKGDGYEGQTACRIPTTVGGAVECEMQVSFGPGQLSIADRGYDASGKQVSGLVAGKSVAFRAATPGITVTKREDGLFIIDIVPPGTEGPVAQLGASSRIAIHYTGWLQSDGAKFAGSRDARYDGSAPEPQLLNLSAQLLSGWAKGMPGMTKGTHRRLIIPSGMAFHNSGSAQWRVPP